MSQEEPVQPKKVTVKKYSDQTGLQKLIDPYGTFITANHAKFVQLKKEKSLPYKLSKRAGITLSDMVLLFIEKIGYMVHHIMNHIEKKTRKVNKCKGRVTHHIVLCAIELVCLNDPDFFKLIKTKADKKIAK
jgi:hypothetical protein